MVTPSKERPVDDPAIWPSLPLAEWRDTHDTLHMWMQIVGKTRLAFAPRQNHWWHVPLYVSSRGLTSTPMPYGSRAFEVEFDFIDHRLIVKTSDGAIRDIALRAQAVADFYREYMGVLASLGITVTLWPVPVEVDHQIPFLEDHLHASYDAGHAHRFFLMLSHADRIMKRFQGCFLGKSSPVHFFWGAGDIALTRFSGRRAPEHKDTEWWVIREANSHEEISVGFWPGSGTVGGTRLLRVRAARAAWLRGGRSGQRPPTIVESWPTSSSLTKRYARHPGPMKRFWISTRACTTSGLISLAGIAQRSTDRQRSGRDP